MSSMRDIFGQSTRRTSYKHELGLALLVKRLIVAKTIRCLLLSAIAWAALAALAGQHDQRNDEEDANTNQYKVDVERRAEAQG